MLTKEEAETAKTFGMHLVCAVSGHSPGLTAAWKADVQDQIRIHSQGRPMTLQELNAIANECRRRHGIVLATDPEAKDYPQERIIAFGSNHR